MRILILGNNYSSEAFLEQFSKNEENIVFSTIQNTPSYIYFENTNDIVEFAQANAINLVLIIDEEYINQGLQEMLSSVEICTFAPSIEAVAISDSKAYAKKFMYKNKIPTPKFQVIDKLQLGLDYIKNSSLPLAIRPDNHNFQECTLFCETYSSGEKILNNFFNSGNKKIVIEDYIEGKNFSIWVLSDGYKAKIIGTSAKYQNNIAFFNPDFLTSDLLDKIQQTIINPTINALCLQNEEYIGILGFDCILTYDNEPYLLGYNSFFDDINVDFYTKGFNVNWENIFESTIIGDVFLKHEINYEPQIMLTLREKEKIKLIKAKTKTNLKIYLDELDYDTEELNEAIKIWKY